jgi:Zn-dependent metalloprotease
MLRFLLLLTFPTVVLLGQVKPIQTVLDPQELARVRSEEARRVRFATGQVNNLRARLGLGANHGFELRGAFTDQWGHTHVRFRQLYKGVRVLGGVVIAHIDPQDRFLDPTAKVFADIDLDVTPAVDAAGARASLVSPGTGAQPEPSLKLDLVILPERELVFTEDTSKRVIPNVPAADEYQWITRKYTLAWYGLLSTDESVEDDREPALAFVDASTGAVFRRGSLRADDTPARGPARTFFHGTVDLSQSLNQESGQYELVDPTRGGSRVRNLNRSSSFQRAKARAFTNATSSWGDGRKIAADAETTSANGQTAAADVAFAMQRSWDLLKNVFSHEGFDTKASPWEARVHFGPNTNEAFWHRTAGAAFFGGGSASAQQPPNDLETVAHELGHGFWYNLVESEGGRDSEADGISQGSADIFASLAEFYLLGNRGRGASLTDVEAAWNFRARMLNPAGTSFQVPDTAPQPGLVYWTANAPSQDEHAVGALYGRLFVLLARGASSATSNPTYSRFFPNGTAGVGIQTAAELWYLATAAYLPDEPDFLELRQAYLLAAAFLYGPESMIYASVLNAFAAVGLAAPAADAAPPALTSLVIQSLDEAEGSMLVSAIGQDDTGILRVEFVINNQVVLTKTRPPYAGYLDISGLAPGTHAVTVRGYDSTNKVGFASLQFGIAGLNQLITDGSFERGGSRWTASPGVIRGGAESFLGTAHAAFAGNSFLSQQFALGTGLTQATLSFRVRVEPSEGVSSGARLDVQLRDSSGTVLETINTYFDSASAPQDELAKNYLRTAFNLTAYRGRTVELRFVCVSPPGSVRFRVDSVSATSVEPASVEAAVEVDDGEASIIYRLNTLTGVRPGQVSRVEYWLDGELDATIAIAPFVAVRSSQGLIRRSHSVIARVFDLAGTRILEASPVSFVLREVNQLVRNGGFETGGTGWVTTGQTSFPRDTATLARSFLGFAAALLGGKGAAHTDDLLQTILIPENATSVTLSFRVRVDSAETEPADTLTVRVFEQEGFRSLLAGTFTSHTNTKGADSAKGYIKRTLDVSQYAGTRLVIHFQAREDTGPPTSFYIDNVSLTHQ